MSATLLIENALADAATLTTTADESTTLDNIHDLATDTFWVPGGGATISGTLERVFVNFTFSTARSLDAIFLAGHNLWTAGAKITLQHDDGGVWTDVAEIDSADLSSDDPVMRVGTAVSDTDWRLNIELDTANDALYFGVIMVGESVAFPRGVNLDYAPDHWNRNDEFETVHSESGLLMQAVRLVKPSMVRIAMRMLPESWVQDEWPAILNWINRYPFAFAWGTTNYPQQAIYCVKRSIETPRLDGLQNRFALSIDAHGYR